VPITMKEISWREGKATEYLGRNRTGKSVGLNVTNTGETLVLRPINSKHLLPPCLVEVPIGHLRKLLDALAAKARVIGQ